MLSSSAISVVVPALDEAACVAAAIASVRTSACEVIVVDGGSRDATAAVAVAAGARVVRSDRGRAAQMTAGARLARGEWLVFLHADTRLAAGWAEAVRALGPDVVGGAFRFRLDSSRRRYRLVEALVRLRCAVLSLPYGDQALFVRRAAFEAGGGFDDVPILEDVDLVQRMRRLGSLALLPIAAVTSPRRWETLGFWRTTLVNASVLLLHALGRPRGRLARLYGVRDS